MTGALPSVQGGQMPDVYFRAAARHWTDALVGAAADSERGPSAIPVEKQLAQVRVLTASIPLWGRELGSLLDATSHGLVGLAFATAPSMLSGLEALARFGAMRSPITEIRGRLASDGYRLAIRPADGCSEAEARELIECTLTSIGCMTFRAYGDRVAAGIRIYCGYCSLPSSASLASVLRCQEERNSWWSGMEIQAGWLDLKPNTADPALFEYALDGLRAEAAKRREDHLVTSIRQFIESSATGLPTLLDVARAHAMSTRTLDRRLRERGRSYRSILDEWRRETGHSLLQNSTLPLDVVARQLGFTESSNFSRWAKRSLGGTPSALRNGGAEGPLKRTGTQSSDGAAVIE